MRILIGHQRAYDVQRICPTATDGKRVLREHAVTELYIDHFLGRGDSGKDILYWAFSHDIWPSKVTLVSNRVHERDAMGKTLKDHGYLTSDGINFLKR